jgi:hypothetical protein
MGLIKLNNPLEIFIYSQGISSHLPCIKNLKYQDEIKGMLVDNIPFNIIILGGSR